jgi:hypothetical protein
MPGSIYVPWLCGSPPAAIVIAAIPSRGYISLLCGSTLNNPLVPTPPTFLRSRVLTLPGSVDPAWTTIRPL